MQRLQLARGVVVEELPNLVRIDLREGGRIVHGAESGRESVHRFESAELVQGGVERQWLVSAERHPLAETFRQDLVKVARQLREVPAQSIVTKQRVHHRLELLALLGAHRCQERLHRGHPLRQLADDVIESARPRKEVAVFGEELGGVRIAAVEPLLQQPVEIADHLPVGGKLFRAGFLDLPRQALEPVVQHLAAQPLRERFEPRARALVHEVVIL